MDNGISILRNLYNKINDMSMSELKKIISESDNKYKKFVKKRAKRILLTDINTLMKK
jgi:hypothetical protein